ncbi:MAG: hypothetical protein HXY34_09220 [Candidatus Thorarchaeota archaeon]|nr:hypothetical protein [Candidatus Thorarchaeota archaeon]
MGIFDTWKRKKSSDSVRSVRGREVQLAGSQPPKVEVSRIEALSPEKQDEVVSLVAEYERLSARREELQRERGDLTARLDRQEITPNDFRKELMARIQEASQVSERLKETMARLTELGYRGVLH